MLCLFYMAYGQIILELDTILCLQIYEYKASSKEGIINAMITSIPTPTCTHTNTHIHQIITLVLVNKSSH